jgi:hypothetical protein
VSSLHDPSQDDNRHDSVHRVVQFRVTATYAGPVTSEAATSNVAPGLQS